MKWALYFSWLLFLTSHLWTFGSDELGIEHVPVVPSVPNKNECIPVIEVIKKSLCGHFYSVFVFQQLIPYVEDDSSKLDDRMANQMRAASEERREVLEVNKVRTLFFWTF